MFKVKIKIIIISILFFSFALISLSANKKVNFKKKAKIKLNEILIDAKIRIRRSSNSRGYDYLKMLPEISVSKSGTKEEIGKSEVLFGASFSFNKAFEITDKQRERKAIKRKGLRKIKSLGFKITKYIDQKFLYINRRWKFIQIKRSMKNPVDIAKVDEKIDDLNFKINNISIDIESSYADIEYVVVEVEK